MHPTDKAARVAGAIYLLGVITGPFSLIYVPNTMIVPGNAAATAANILAHETIFRLGILGDLLTGVWALAITFALYRLFRGVDQSLAAVMVILGGLMPASIFFVNSLNWIAALILAHGTDLAAFTSAQQDALTMLFMHLHSKGNVVNSILLGALAVSVRHARDAVGLSSALFGCVVDRRRFRLSRREFGRTFRPAIPRYGLYDFAAPDLVGARDRVLAARHGDKGSTLGRTRCVAVFTACGARGTSGSSPATYFVAAA